MKRLWFALLPLALLAVVTGVFLLWPEPAALPLLADSRAATAEVGAAADERAAARTEPAGAREEITAPLMPEPEAAASVVLVGSLTGRVVGRDTGALAGATVALDWEDPAGATRAAIGLRPTATDARGRFAYADLLASGRYRVRVRCAGFVPLHSSDLGIYPGQSTDAGDLVLTPGARLVGSIADDRGAPLARASVQIKDRDQGSALTDDRGEFVLADLEAGPVVVLASAADCWPAQQEVTLEAGREAPPVRFTLRRPAIITGSVSSRDHAAIAGATVRTSARGNGPPVLTDAQGRYRLQVAQRDQSYRVEVAALGHRPQARGLVAPQDNADFVLEPLPRIEVLLRDASTGAPIKPLVLRRRGNQPRLAAEPESMAAPPRSADDERAWQRLGPGRYGVFYSQPGTYRVVALADGYAASETEPVAADGTSSYGPFLMAMSKLDATETGAVGGIVRNLSTQAPVAGATVELCDDASDSGARALFRYGVLVPASGAVVATTRTDPQGRFLFTELKSQGYTLRAISSSHAASESVNSAVVAGVASPDVELWLRRGGAIAGVVRGLDGAALADLPLVVLRADGFADVTRTDTAGAYRFDRLAAGSYRVETGDRTTAPSQEWPRGKGAGGSALEARDFHVEVAEGRVTPLDIDLQHPPGWATVFGSVTRDGVVPADFSVELVRQREPSEGFDAGLHQPRVQLGARDGAYVFASVRRGTYLVRVRHGGLTATRLVLAAPGDALRVDFALELGKLKGRTLALRRRPVPLSARLRLIPLSPRDWQMELREYALSDAAGNFDFGVLPAGNYRLETTADDLATDVRELRVRTGETLGLTIELRP